MWNGGSTTTKSPKSWWGHWRDLTSTSCWHISSGDKIGIQFPLLVLCSASFMKEVKIFFIHSQLFIYWNWKHPFPTVLQGSETTWVIQDFVSSEPGSLSVSKGQQVSNQLFHNLFPSLSKGSSDLIYDWTRGPWTATPVLIKMMRKEDKINRHFYMKNIWNHMRFSGKRCSLFQQLSKQTP